MMILRAMFFLILWRKAGWGLEFTIFRMVSRGRSFDVYQPSGRNELPFSTLPQEKCDGEELVRLSLVRLELQRYSSVAEKILGGQLCREIGPPSRRLNQIPRS
jgi:hypothetical protein